MSILCSIDLTAVPEQDTLLERYAAVGHLLNDGTGQISSATHAEPGFGKEGVTLKDKTVEMFWLLKRYQYQWEDVLYCCMQAISTRGLGDFASELGLTQEDLAVQREIYQHTRLSLKDLPPLIAGPEAHEVLDPTLLDLYEKAVTLDYATLSKIFGNQNARKADACITLAKLAFARSDSDFKFGSVLIHPILPGQPGSVIVSPTLLFDSLLFRFAMLFSLAQ